MLLRVYYCRTITIDEYFGKMKLKFSEVLFVISGEAEIQANSYVTTTCASLERHGGRVGKPGETYDNVPL